MPKPYSPEFQVYQHPHPSHLFQEPQGALLDLDEHLQMGQVDPAVLVAQAVLEDPVRNEQTNKKFTIRMHFTHMNTSRHVMYIMTHL